jgi:invasion protein IalB
MMSLRFAGTCAILALVSAVALPAIAPPSIAAEPTAPVAAEPQSTMSTYGDWIVRCLRTDGPNAAHVCEAAQLWSSQGQQAPVVQIVIARPNPKDPMKLSVQMPLNVGFPSSVKLVLDDKDAPVTELNWRRCVPGGCFADTEIKDDAVKRFRAQTANAKLQFKNAAGVDATLPVSFRGFPQAMDGLAKAQ